MSIGITEIALIGLLAIIFISPERTKDYIKRWYKMRNDIKQAKKEVQEELNNAGDILKDET